MSWGHFTSNSTRSGGQLLSSVSPSFTFFLVGFFIIIIIIINITKISCHILMSISPVIFLPSSILSSYSSCFITSPNWTNWYDIRIKNSRERGPLYDERLVLTGERTGKLHLDWVKLFLMFCWFSSFYFLYFPPNKLPAFNNGTGGRHFGQDRLQRWRQPLMDVKINQKTVAIHLLKRFQTSRGVYSSLGGTVYDC